MTFPRWLSVAVLAIVTASPAWAVDVAQLAGWWLAEHRALAALTERGLTQRVEELLIVETDGRFEDRTVTFVQPDEQFCRDDGICSDAPVAMRGRFVSSGDALTVEASETTKARLDHPKVDAAIRTRLVASLPSWRVQLLQNGEVLELRGTGRTTRRFARIEPDRLRRLHSAFLAAEVSAIEHWPCFRERAAGLGVNDPRTDEIARMLRVGALVRAIESAFRRVSLAISKPEIQRFRAERLLVEPIALPTTGLSQDLVAHLGGQLAWLSTRRAGGSRAEADAALRQVAGRPGEPPVAEADIPVLRDLATSGPIAQSLFCLDLKPDDSPPSTKPLRPARR